MSTTAEILQAQKRKLQKTLDNKASIKQAITNKRGGIDIGENQSTWASEIESIEPLLDTLEINDNGNFNVKDYKNVNVLVANDYLEMIKNMLLTYSGSTEIVVPEGVTIIGDSAFFRNKGSYNMPMKTYIPKTIQEIGGNNFGYYTVYYNGTFDEWIKVKKGNDFSGFYSIGTDTLACRFYYKDSNNNYVLSHENIGDYIIPNEITELKQGAFSGFTIKSGSKIHINSNVKKIGTGCFYLLKGVEEIIFEEGMSVDLTLISYLFSYSDIQKISLPITTEIGKATFKYCEKLEEVNFSEGLLYLGHSGYMSIGETFQSCTKLKKVNFPSTLLKINNNSFYGCTSLQNLTIPQSVQEMGSYVFYNMTGNIVMESSTPCTISSSTFSSFKGKIYVPKGSRETFISATNWSSQASKIYEKYVVVFNIPSTLLNNETITYSIDGGKTYQMFTNGTLSLNEVATIKIKSTDSTQVVKVGTSAGASDVGTISNSEITFAFTTDTNVYLTIQ